MLPGGAFGGGPRGRGAGKPRRTAHHLSGGAGAAEPGTDRRSGERGICVSAGSACSRGHRSHVLEAMEVPGEWIDGAIRVSLGFETTDGDIDAFLTALPQAVSQLKKNQ